MREISKLEIDLLAAELRSQLISMYVDRFYEIERGRFRIRFSAKGRKADLLCVLGETLNITAYVESAESPTGFASAMRKRIEGCSVEDIYTYGNDRIAVIGLKKGAERQSIIVEMFGKGNLILVDDSMQIKLAYTTASYGKREVRQGQRYEAPQTEAEKVSAESLAMALERAKAQGAEARLMSSITKHINIGTVYIENAIVGAGLDPKAKLAGLTAETIESAAKAVVSLARMEMNPEPTIYRDQSGKVVDYSVLPIGKYADLKAERCESLSQMLDRFYHELPGEEEASESVKELEKSIEKQRAILAQIDQRISDNKAVGDAIYGRMWEINGLIDDLKANRNATVEAVQPRHKGIKILKIDLKSKTVRVDI
ncbi:MAG: NFACT family protein [Candidatus Micrarchaeota archaeon]|nr:NFACT family protein [Candidatus Micrarchaeota archaeon]